MNIGNTNNKTNTTETKDFWDTLQSEILISNERLSQEDLACLIELNYMYSIFFRRTSYKELISFKKLLDLNDTGYIVLLEFITPDRTDILDTNVDVMGFYRFLKNLIPDNTSHAIGPLVANRFGFLISDTTIDPMELSGFIMEEVTKEYKLPLIAGIGNIQTLPNIYHSFLEALTAMHMCKPGQVMHTKDIQKVNSSHHFNYHEAEKYMLESIRAKKTDAYDYFIYMLSCITPLNDQAKRNKILESLVLASHAAYFDMDSNINPFNYSIEFNSMMNLSGDELIEWANQKFLYITGYVKPQSNIDYSNKIVQATKEYLESHYMEDITLEMLAEQVNISPQYFSKLIKKNTGFNFIDWLSMLRVKKAKELLTNSSYTVKEVCFMVGYKDPNYFSRIFKKRIGITPSEYIKNKAYLNNMN